MAKDKADYWEGQIKEGLTWRKKTSREKDWDRIRMYWEHEYSNASDPHFNLIYMLGSSLIPALVYQNPGIMNTVRRPEFSYWGSFFDGIDNWLIDEMEVQDSMEDAVLYAFLYNMAGIEIGYDFPADRSFTGEEMVFGSVPGVVDRSRKENQPWMDIIDPRKLILAPGTKNMKNCRWYAKYVELPTKVLKKKKGMKNVEATHIPTEIRGTEDDVRANDDREYTGFYIVHEQENNTWLWIDTNGKYIVPPEKDPLQVDGLPMETLTFNKGVRGLWGTPDSIYVESQQMEGDELRKDGRLQRKGALVKCFYDNELLDEDDITKFITSAALGCVPVSVPQDKSLKDVIHMVQPHVQGEYSLYAKELLNDAQLLSGNGPNQFGTFASGRRTKYETQVVEERNFLRTGARRSKVGQVIGKQFGRINQLIVQHWQAPMVAQVIGKEGATHWVTALPSEFKELKAQLVTKVNIESLAPVSRERRKQEMVEVMEVVAKFGGMMEGVNIMPIIQNFLSQFDWTDTMNTLPQAQQQGPVPIDEFAGQQQKLQGPGLQQQLGANLGSMGSLIQQLPSQGTTKGASK